MGTAHCRRTTIPISGTSSRRIVSPRVAARPYYQTASLHVMASTESGPTSNRSGSEFQERTYTCINDGNLDTLP